MNNKGQFSIIAALLVAVVLVAAVMTTYSAIRYSPVQGQPQILSAVDETNLALKQLLGFTVGYYGSVLKVTGNVTYAQQLATKYLNSSLTNVGYINPEWGLSLNITDLRLSTNWFTDDSYSQGTMQVTYDLNGLGITGISYSTSSRLEVQMTNNYSSTQAQFKILSDNGEPIINLGSNNMKFYRYNYKDSTWEYSVPTNIISYGDGTYLADLPVGVLSDSYMVQVDDTRGISVLASSFNQFTTAIVWNSTISSLINLQESTFTLELLQNGTMRWLGQDMQLTTQAMPIPPISVKAIHVNQTVNGVPQEVPFQVEDWASDYQIPQGLTSNTTIFSNRQMIVFLLSGKVSNFTVWWDGSDAATQTPLAFTNSYFNNDDPAASTLSNGIVTLLFGSFNVKSTVVGTTISSTAYFMRLNQEASTYGAGLSYVIHHGIVRDVVQQEAEWSTGADGCPNFYSNMVLTLPANVTYYTYYLRIMFINSSQARSITDLSPIRITTSLSSPQIQTENGTLAGFPIVQNGTGTFLNSSSSSWTAHHFSQFISDTGQGAGIMFTDKDNQILYAFDTFSGSSSKGALKASSGLIELLPVSSGQVQFNYAYDIAWRGAVVTFDNTTPVFSLYNATTPTGLWMLVEYPPILTVTASLQNPLTVSVAPSGSLDIGVGQTQSFTTTSTGGTGRKSYQWYLDGAVLSGQTTSTYTYAAALGSHTIYVRVTDSAPTPTTAQSNTVSTVTAALSVSVAPVGPLTMNAGQAQTFTASVSGGTGTKSYQWYLDGSVVSGQTASTYAYTAATSGSPDSVYVRVTDSASTPVSVNSNSVSITVYAQVTFVSAGTGSGVTGNPTPGYPSGMQSGDLILLQVTVRNTATTPTTPLGFTALYSADSTGTGRQWIYYKFATGSESGSITVSIAGSVTKMARMYAFRNVALSSFTEAASFGSGTAQPINARPVTTTNNARLAVSFVFVNYNNAVNSFTGETGGDWIESVNEFTTTAGSRGCIQLQTATMATAGTITGGSYTMSAANPWGVRAFALVPR
jgi:uncharacterized protein (UPF0333 family)